MSPSVLEPGGRRRRRWPLWLGIGALVVAGAAIAAYLAFFQKPGNVSHPNVDFTAPTPAPKARARATTGRDWPLYGLDPQRTRYMADVSVKPPYRVLWAYGGGKSLIEFQPVLAKGVLYVLPNNGIATALSARSGKVIWHRRVGALAASSPAWAAGHLFLVANRAGSAGIASAGAGTLWCLDAKTGKAIWKRTLASASESSPLVIGGRVYLGSQDGTVYAVDAQTGAIRWRYHASGAVKAGIALAQGRLFVGDYSGGMTALTTGGHVVWHVNTSGLAFSRSGNFYATPSVAFGRVFAGNTDGFIYSFAARSGQLAWRHATGGYVYAAPVAADVPGMPPAVFAGSYSGHFYALDARSGNVIWTYNAGGTISGAASLIGNVVYFSTLSKKTTTGLDARTGHVVWHFYRGAFNPAISDGLRLYLTGYSSLYAFLPKGAAAAATTAARAQARAHAKSSHSGRSKRSGSSH